MKAIRTNAIEILRENYKAVNPADNTFREYVECSQQSDENFFMWLFDAIGDEEFTMSEEMKDDWEAFLDECETAVTYDVQFDDETASNNEGFSESYEYCKNYIENNRNDKTTYFGDYKGGVVSIVENETGRTVYEEEIK